MLNKKSHSTATITWITYPNFGTYLQAYALQQYIISLGYDNSIIDDATIIESYSLGKDTWKQKLKIKIKLLSKSFRELQRAQKISFASYNKFKREYLFIDYNTLPLSFLDTRYNTYICGSDQIWNPFSLGYPNSSFFYADFTYKKKIAYAPSIGVSQIPQKYERRFADLISNFRFLSAREEQGRNIMSKLTKKEIVKVVDPTLLLCQNDWNELLKTNSDSEPYVLVYLLTPNNKYLNAAKSFAHQHGLPLKIVFLHSGYYSEADELILGGPIEFLQAINNASYLFTDSFHGSIFASIFHVQFVTFRRFQNVATSQNSRIENLLSMMNIPERLIGEDDLCRIAHLNPIDFVQLENSISPFILKSKQYLSTALA